MDSSNYDPCLVWSYGCHMAAINYQYPGRAMVVNRAKFRDNGNIGCVSLYAWVCVGMGAYVCVFVRVCARAWVGVWVCACVFPCFPLHARCSPVAHILLLLCRVLFLLLLGWMLANTPFYI